MSDDIVKRLRADLAAAKRENVEITNALVFDVKKAEADLAAVRELLKEARSRMSRDAQGEDALLDRMDAFLKGDGDE